MIRSPAQALSQDVTSAVKRLRPELEHISRTIHDDPETAFEEHRAVELLTAWLAARGFSVQVPVAEIGTAFVASFGTTGARRPRIAFLAEYDALPGLGHGCGHNLIAAGAVVAAAALVELRPQLDGEVLVIGTPAEEGGGGKVMELQRGVFDGVDAALMFHPADRTLPWRHAKSSAHLRVTFRGRAAHAAKNPQDGANALAAMIQLFVALDGLRQHLRPTAQIHGVIRNGGDAPNIVPDLTIADFLVREDRMEAAGELVERFRACAAAAALATGTSAQVDETAPTYSERKNNHALAERVASYLELQGVPVEPASTSNPAGSSDIGNVSLAIPVIHPYLAVAQRGTPGHSVAFRHAVVQDEAHDATEKMAAALCQAAIDLFEEPGFLDQVKEEFARSGPDLGGPADAPA